MLARTAPLVAAAFAGLAVPAEAQDVPIPPLPPLPEAVAPAPEPFERPAPALAVEQGWEGEWEGEWAPDGSWRGTWTGTWSEPGPTAQSPSAYASPDRAAWLDLCRAAYYPAATIPAGSEPDACDAYLLQYERAARAGSPGAYAYPAAPVMWVRVPIIREPDRPGAPDETGE